MSIASKIRRGQRAAVFTRNFKDYLDEAVAIAASDPTRRVTFRGVRSWASAEEALAVARPIPIYVAPNGGDGVEYVADLHQVQLRPVLGDPTTDELMKHVLPSTAAEGLWGGTSGRAEVETLYVISNCRKVAPFSTTKLTKLSDGKPLREEYRYSYSVVQAL